MEVPVAHRPPRNGKKAIATVFEIPTPLDTSLQASTKRAGR